MADNESLVSRRYHRAAKPLVVQKDDTNYHDLELHRHEERGMHADHRRMEGNADPGRNDDRIGQLESSGSNAIRHH